MFEIVCVTNRRLCKEDFLERLDRIASSKPDAIILREKDLSETEYRLLAIKTLDICNRYGVRCILHSFVSVAEELKTSVHLPMSVLRSMDYRYKALTFGASCHSVSEAVEAQNYGCGYITVGHIFETDCKKGLCGRGLEFLREVTNAVNIPIYAIGGIDETNIGEVLRSGARGACVMSGAFRCEDVERYFYNLKKIVRFRRRSK